MSLPGLSQTAETNPASWKPHTSSWRSWRLMNWQQQRVASLWGRGPPNSAPGKWTSTTTASAPSWCVCWSSPPWSCSKETRASGRYHQLLFWCKTFSSFRFLTLLPLQIFNLKDNEKHCVLFWVCFIKQLLATFSVYQPLPNFSF